MANVPLLCTKGREKKIDFYKCVCQVLAELSRKVKLHISAQNLSARDNENETTRIKYSKDESGNMEAIRQI